MLCVSISIYFYFLLQTIALPWSICGFQLCQLGMGSACIVLTIISQSNHHWFGSSVFDLSDCSLLNVQLLICPIATKSESVHLLGFLLPESKAIRWRFQENKRKNYQIQQGLSHCQLLTSVNFDFATVTELKGFKRSDEQICFKLFFIKVYSILFFFSPFANI